MPRSSATGLKFFEDVSPLIINTHKDTHKDTPTEGLKACNSPPVS